MALQYLDRSACYEIYRLVIMGNKGKTRATYVLDLKDRLENMWKVDQEELQKTLLL